MTADHIGIAMAMGFFSMLIYVEGLRPLLKIGIRELRNRWYMYTSARLTDAEARGYGWAWASVMVESKSLDSVKARVHPSISPTGAYGTAFDRGVCNAIDDIEQFQCLKEEREEDA